MKWKNINTGIDELDEKYEVSDTGVVRSVDRNITYISGVTRFHKGKVLAQIPDKDGYLKVGLHSQKINKMVGVHRLVARSFIKNDDPENKIYINHKDENKRNNVYTNLEWCTAYYNNHYGVRAVNQRIHTGFPCLVINPITGNIRHFFTITEASLFLDVTMSSVVSYIRGRYKSVSNCIVIPEYLAKDIPAILIRLKRYYSSFSPGIIYYRDKDKANYFFSSLDSASNFTGIIKTSVSKQANKGYLSERLSYAFRKATIYETATFHDSERLPQDYWNPDVVKPVFHTTMIKCLETGTIYNSASEASRFLGTDPSAVLKVCKGIQSHTHGYHLVYV